MDRKFSLCIHDLKISGNDITVEKIQFILSKFKTPLTVHLVFDRPLEKKSALFKFLSKNIKKNNIEIVFHGVTHKCSKRVLKILSFYHKYQAEYLEDSDSLRSNTGKKYKELSALLNANAGICPPCWIASKKNLLFLRNLNPPYIESILGINYKSRSIFSPVISLGSIKNSELFFLKKIAAVMYMLSIIKKHCMLRIAIHECDLDREDSVNYFANVVKSLKRHSFETVLLKDLKDLKDHE